MTASALAHTPTGRLMMQVRCCFLRRVMPWSSASLCCVASSVLLTVSTLLLRSALAVIRFLHWSSNRQGVLHSFALPRYSHKKLCSVTINHTLTHATFSGCLLLSATADTGSCSLQILLNSPCRSC